MEDSARRVYCEHLVEGYSARLMCRDVIVHSVEAKLAKMSIHRHALSDGFRVAVNDEHVVKASSLELQITHKDEASQKLSHTMAGRGLPLD